MSTLGQYGLMQKNNAENNVIPSASVAAAQNIARLRSDHGWSRREFLHRLQQQGITMQSTALRRIEAGEQRIRLDEADAIAKIFDITLDDLIASADPTVQADEAAEAAQRQGRAAGRRLRSFRYGLEEVHTELQAVEATHQVQIIREWLNAAIRSIDDISGDLIRGPRQDQQRSHQEEAAKWQEDLAETAADRAVELGLIGPDDAARIGSRPISLHPHLDIQREVDAWLKNRSRH